LPLLERLTMQCLDVMQTIHWIKRVDSRNWGTRVRAWSDRGQ